MNTLSIYVFLLTVAPDGLKTDTPCRNRTPNAEIGPKDNLEAVSKRIDKTTGLL